MQLMDPCHLLSGKRPNGLHELVDDARPRRGSVEYQQAAHGDVRDERAARQRGELQCRKQMGFDERDARTVQREHDPVINRRTSIEMPSSTPASLNALST
jgi:hypothetical protein